MTELCIFSPFPTPQRWSPRLYHSQTRQRPPSGSRCRWMSPACPDWPWGRGASPSGAAGHPPCAEESLVLAFLSCCPAAAGQLLRARNAASPSSTLTTTPGWIFVRNSPKSDSGNAKNRKTNLVKDLWNQATTDFFEYLPTKSKSVKIFITFSYRAVHTVLWQTQCNEGWASWLFIITAYIRAEECKTLRWTYLGSNLWNEMSQRSHVTWIVPYRCSLRQVDRWEGIYECSFFLVRSCLLVTLIKCLKGHTPLYVINAKKVTKLWKVVQWQLVKESATNQLNHRCLRCYCKIILENHCFVG